MSAQGLPLKQRTLNNLIMVMRCLPDSINDSSQISAAKPFIIETCVANANGLDNAIWSSHPESIHEGTLLLLFTMWKILSVELRLPHVVVHLL